MQVNLIDLRIAKNVMQLAQKILMKTEDFRDVPLDRWLRMLRQTGHWRKQGKVHLEPRIISLGTASRE